MCSGQGKGRGDDAATGCLEVDDSSVRLALLRRADHCQLQTSLSLPLLILTFLKNFAIGPNSEAVWLLLERHEAVVSRLSDSEYFIVLT